MLVEGQSGQPVHGAFVALINAAGAEVARTLSDADGGFSLAAPGAGAYHLRSERIGFRPSESRPLALAAGQTLQYRFAIETMPVTLPAVVVEGRPRCGEAAEQATATAGLWEEAREALSAVKWTQAQGTLHYTVERFEREMPITGREVLAERHGTWSGTGLEPFHSIPAEQLAEHGYVVFGPHDTTSYYGPDADVLLGDVFVNSHCFSARDGGAAHPGLIGLAFQPAPERKVPDILGVLWLDKHTLELRSLTFTYTILRKDSLGGRVTFARLPSGPWIVSSWLIRTPHTDAAFYSARHRHPPRLLDFHETGGMVLSATSTAGGVSYTGAPSVIEGSVVDSSRGKARPLSHAIVVLLGTDRADTTDERGAFRIAGALGGTYRVSFRHPRLDSMGFVPDPQTVVLRQGEQAQLVLAIPPERDVVAQICPGALHEDQGVIVGLVRDAGAAPVPDALISIGLSGKTPRAAATADGRGRFVICGVRVGSMSMSATDGTRSSDTITLRFTDTGTWVAGAQSRSTTGRIWMQDIVLRP
jgi:Carboxypeptidase regulatory-like domain